MRLLRDAGRTQVYWQPLRLAIAAGAVVQTDCRLLGKAVRHHSSQPGDRESEITNVSISQAVRLGRVERTPPLSARSVDR
jgi:hypothetical protein